MAQVQTGSGMRIGRVLGIPVYLHTSWFIIFALITVSLGMQFAAEHPHWTSAQHWTLGIITSVLFFGSVLFHEISHSVVAMRYRVPVRSITLFVFGGLAQIERDAPTPRQEINIAVAGPISSLLLAACFWLVWRYSHAGAMVESAAYWLAEINLVLALFNLVPGFPLDGGRALRGIVWSVTGDFARATRIATSAGKFVAYFLILLGIWQALSGRWVAGLWLAFIGWFLLEAARESFARVAIRDILAEVRAEDIMAREIPTVSRSDSIAEYVQEVLRTGRRCHIVTGIDSPVGLVTLHSTQSVPRDEWTNTSVQAAMVPIDRVQAAAADEPALHVLDRMQKANIGQMPVISDGHIVGIVGRESILRVLQTHWHASRLA